MAAACSPRERVRSTGGFDCWKWWRFFFFLSLFFFVFYEKICYVRSGMEDDDDDDLFQAIEKSFKSFYYTSK